MNTGRKYWTLLWHLFSLIILNVHIAASIRCEWKHDNVNYDNGPCSTTTVVCKNITMSTLNEFHTKQVSQDCYSKRCYAVDIHNSQINSVDKTTLVTKLSCKLYEITLTSDHIHTISDNAFMNYPKVWKLNLENNEISTLGFLRSDFGNLRILNLAFNKLERIEKSTFEHLANLEDLYLNNNLLNSIDDEVFTNLVNLKHLSLNNNNLQVLSQNMFKGLLKNSTDLSGSDALRKSSFIELQELDSSNLTELNVGNLSPGTLNSLSHLETLDLHGNKLETIPDRAFFYLHAVEVLDLSNNKISALSPDSLAGLINLRRLQLNNNLIREVPLGVFKSFPLLENLQLGNNYLSVLQRGSFSNLRELQHLNLSHNQLSSIDEPALFSLTSLSSLSLDNNDLEYINHHPLLLHLPNLKFINVNNNKWFCDLLAVMIQEFKKRNITYSLGVSTHAEESIDGISCKKAKIPENFSQKTADPKYPLEIQNTLDQLGYSTKNVSDLLTAVKDSMDMFSEYNIKHLENYNKSNAQTTQMQSAINNILTSNMLKLNKLNDIINSIGSLSGNMENNFLNSESQFRKILENQKSESLKYATREEYLQLVDNLTKIANSQSSNMYNLRYGLYAIFLVIVMLFVVIIVLLGFKCFPRTKKNYDIQKTRSEIELLNSSP